MTIVIIGAGYVGLPLAIAFAKYHSVICYDISQKRVEELQKGNDSNKQHEKKEIIKKSLNFTSDPAVLKKKIFILLQCPHLLIYSINQI